MRHDIKKPLTKCDKCGVLKKSKSKYCQPCQDEVREEYRRNYDKLYK
jgi:uncharacterized OB-fold protein